MASPQSQATANLYRTSLGEEVGNAQGRACRSTRMPITSSDPSTALLVGASRGRGRGRSISTRPIVSVSGWQYQNEKVIR